MFKKSLEKFKSENRNKAVWAFSDAKQITKEKQPSENERLNYDFSSIEEAAAYSKFDNIRPGGVSKYSKDAHHFKTLFYTNRAEKGWGVSEEVAVDELDNKPYWIVTQYDGALCAQTWYLEKKPLTYSEVAAYAKEKSVEFGRKFQDITEENWREKL